MIKMPQGYPVTSHTDFVQEGSTFFALQGAVSHGLYFIKQAVNKGAKTIVFDQNSQVPFELLDWLKSHSISIQYVANPRCVLARMAAKMAGYPAQKLKIFGITGTKGKTTSVHLLAAIFKKAGYKTAFLSSVYNSIDDSKLSSFLTTPQADYIHQFLKICVENGVTHVVIEVAAQALTLHRIEGIEFDGIIMTNFSREHLEFYNSMDEYLDAKKKILEHQKPGSIVLVNKDDSAFASFAHRYKTFSCFDNEAFVFGNHLNDDLYSGLSGIITINEISINISNQYFYGYYNFYNIMAVVGLAYLLNIPVEIIKSAISEFKSLLGRCERYHLANGVTCFVDKAYNPLSFQAFLSVVRGMTSQLIVVFGAGGDRDHGRRPMMGQVASLYADYIVLTSDNPRSEDPSCIVQDILRGIDEKKKKTVFVILDRKEAIIHALLQAKPGAIVALLGKGDERYQVFNNKKEFFSETEILNEYEQNYMHFKQ